MLPVSYLFVPATRCERIGKAWAVGAQAVIVDLEDAVDPAHKDAARDQVAQALPAGAPPVWLRINGLSSPWFAQDLTLVQTLADRQCLAGVMLPKTEAASDLAAVETHTHAPLIALVESARGINALREIAQYPGLHRLAFGSADLARDLGCEDSWDTLLRARQEMVLQAAAAGLPASIDGVSFVLDQSGPVQADAQRAARHGFGAKLCIHPAQIKAVHQGFAPSAEQLSWARSVLAAAEHGQGAQRLAGQMIDRPLIERARQLLARALPAQS